MRAHALFGRMSDLSDRLNGLKLLAEQRSGALVRTDAALAKRLAGFAEEVGALRKEIVATKEGGAITGEERLREHLDYAYGALISYEGRPGDYQIARVATLERELTEVDDRATRLLQRHLPSLNDALKRNICGMLVPALAGNRRVRRR